MKSERLWHDLCACVVEGLGQDRGAANQQLEALSPLGQTTLQMAAGEQNLDMPLDARSEGLPELEG